MQRFTIHSQFSPKNENLSTENNFKRFLENYPEKEFWRFFVERNRYDLREVSNHMYHTLHLIKDKVDFVTVGELYEFATEMNKNEMIEVLDGFNLQYRKAEKVVDIINKQIGWVGFEYKEPGYLTSITNAFNYILKYLVDNKKLDLDFIKEIHKLATQNVKNILAGNKPGEFRKCNVGWGMTQMYDSLDGLKETIDYLKTIEREWSNSVLLIYAKDANKIIKAYKTFVDKDTQDIAVEIWDLVKANNGIDYITTDATSIDNSKDFLTVISNKHLEELEQALISAKSKEQKLTAIFTYLKHTVLHHAFHDGEGRTFSMLLLQYLLIRENFLPILIKNSNIIPGYSVKELVEEYLRAESEMELILKTPNYINSKDIIENNINTDQILKTLSQQEQDMFLTNLLKYRNTKDDCLVNKNKVHLKK